MDFQPLTDSNGVTLSGALILTPKLFQDERGFFSESWNQRIWKEIMRKQCQESKPFVQDNHSKSIKNTLRGLHFQISPDIQGKLVRCIVGEIFDVAVDLRLNSGSFGKWGGINISSTNKKQIWIPEGFAHGFLTLSDEAEVLYKTTSFWNPTCERTIRWDDETIGINWPINSPDSAQPKLSEKDNKAISLEQINREDLF